MSKFRGIARAGLTSVLLHPGRSVATLVCLVAIIAPFAAGSAVARGVLDQVDASIESGADLHVTGARFGRPAPVPIAAAETLRALPGVRTVVPRIVGEVTLGKEQHPVVVVGRDRLPETAECVEGRLFRARHELVLGTKLARRLGLAVGSVLPPFYTNRTGEHVSTVVGVFRADLPIWEGSLMFCSLETATEVFDQPGLVTGFLVECEPGYREDVKRAILRLPALAPSVSPVVLSRADARAMLPRSMRHLEGLWNLHFVLAFAVGIPLLMVVSGFGLSERRREAALLKATGWMTDELLLKGFVESLVLCVVGASLAVLLAWGWLEVLDGAGLAGLFLPGADAGTPVPFRLLPVTAVVAFIVSFAVVATGTLYSTWRAATAAPALAMR